MLVNHREPHNLAALGGRDGPSMRQRFHDNCFRHPFGLRNGATSTTVRLSFRLSSGVFETLARVAAVVRPAGMRREGPL